MLRVVPSVHSASLGVAAIALAMMLALVSPPIAFAQAPAGTISSARGQVQVQRGATTSNAGPGTALSTGDRVFTGTNSRATLSLADGSSLELGPSTSMTIDSTAAAAGAPTRVGLFSGVLRSIVNAGGGAANYQVHTPNAVAAVRGTRFDTAYSEGVVRPGYEGCDRYTDVSVYAGRVNLANNAAPNAGTDVDAGYEATVPCQSQPTTPGPLAMTGAVSLDSAVGAGGFVGTLPGSSGAPPPACPVCPGGTAPPPSGLPPNPGLR